MSSLKTRGFVGWCQCVFLSPPFFLGTSVLMSFGFFGRGVWQTLQERFHNRLFRRVLAPFGSSDWYDVATNTNPKHKHSPGSPDLPIPATQHPPPIPPPFYIRSSTPQSSHSPGNSPIFIPHLHLNGLLISHGKMITPCFALWLFPKDTPQKDMT